VDFSTVSMPLPPLPPPPHPNASRRWTFLAFQHVWHHHHLPRIQMRAGAGLFSGFKAAAIASTSLVFKREPEVNFLGILTPSSGGYSSRGIRHQRRRGGVKPTHHCVRMFSLPFWAPGAVRNFVASFATPK